MSALSPLASAGLARAGVLAGSLSESEASRRVYLAAGGLALLGLVLLVGTVWWWRSTRNEHPSLAPLEVMGAKRWRKASVTERQRLVDRVRPEGAQTGAPVVAPEPVDLAALAIGDHAGFDDLREIDELLGLDVEHLLALKPRPASDDAGADSAAVAESAVGAEAEAAAPVDESDVPVAGPDVPVAEVPAGAAADAADVDVEDETVAIGAEAEAEPVQFDERDDEDEAGDEDLDAAPESAGADAQAEVARDGAENDAREVDAAEVADTFEVDAAEVDEIADEGTSVDDAPSAPGDPLLERTVND